MALPAITRLKMPSVIFVTCSLIVLVSASRRPYRTQHTSSQDSPIKPGLDSIWSAGDNSKQGQCINNANPGPINDQHRSAYIEASHKFTLAAFQAVHKLSSERKQQSNLIFSPYSIWQAAVLTYLVAGGSTKDDIERTLGLETIGKDAVYQIFKSLQIPAAENDQSKKPSYFSAYGGPDMDDSLIMESANRIYIESSLEPETLNSKTVRLLQNEIYKSDFSRNPERVRGDINNWIANMTRGKIRDMFSPHDVNSATMMVLANAAYFRGSWDRRFLESMTSSQCFFLDPARTEAVKVPMMRNTAMKLNVYFSEAFRATIIKIPYYQDEESPTLGEVNMYLMVPEESPDWSVDDIIKKMTPDQTDALSEVLYGGKQHMALQFSMPKFKFETKLNLKEVLSELGLGSAFGGPTNFECLSERLSGVPLTAKHQAVIDVNEKGTEAAASTGSLVEKSGSFLPTIAHLNVDRPFVYAIIGSRRDEALFMGVARNPSNN